MKLRLSTPRHLVDLNFIPETSYIPGNGALRIGAMTRHSQIAASPDAARIPILRDNYIGLLRKEGDSDYGVSFPDFPGIATAGTSLDDARAMAEEALALHIEGLLEDHETDPRTIGPRCHHARPG